VEPGGRRDDHGVDILSFEKRLPIRVVMLDFELGGYLLRSRAIRVRYSDEPGIGNRATQVFGVVLAQPADSNHSHSQFSHGFGFFECKYFGRLEIPIMLPVVSRS
jgi:hypothetical protein